MYKSAKKVRGRRSLLVPDRRHRNAMRRPLLAHAELMALLAASEPAVSLWLGSSRLGFSCEMAVIDGVGLPAVNGQMPWTGGTILP
jgi:hypothetical protein